MTAGPGTSPPPTRAASLSSLTHCIRCIIIEDRLTAQVQPCKCVEHLMLRRSHMSAGQMHDAVPGGVVRRVRSTYLDHHCSQQCVCACVTDICMYMRAIYKLENTTVTAEAASKFAAKSSPNIASPRWKAVKKQSSCRKQKTIFKSPTRSPLGR